ncbi:MAG: domain S-box protein [Segetibacter sp.]|nr:domain S-box protein [Segetibacter sp.]
MKALKKPEVVLTLLFVVVAHLCVFLNDAFVFLANKYIQKEYVKHFENYKIPFLILFFAVIIFYSIKHVRIKIFNSQKQYYNLFESNPLPMAIVDLDTQEFLAVNIASIECYGYSRKEFLTMSISDIRVEEDLNQVEQLLKAQQPGLKKGGIKKHKKKNSEIIIVEVSTGEVFFKNKKCCLLLARDITEIVKAREDKKNAEEERARQEHFYAYVLENFPIDVAVFDKEHRYVLLNKNAVKNDETRKWMIGKDDFDYFMFKGNTDMTIPEKRRERFLRAVAGESEEWIDEHLIDGRKRYLLRKFFPYFENGSLKYIFGYGTDITELKKAEIQRDEYIQQLEKIAFATSHKVRQPICNLQGLVSLLELDNFDRHELSNITTVMQKSIDQMDEVTRDLALKLHDYKQNLATTRNAAHPVAEHPAY